VAGRGPRGAAPHHQFYCCTLCLACVPSSSSIPLGSDTNRRKWKYIFDLIAAEIISMHAPTPAAPVVDTTVCHQDADGRWVSDYSQSGLCTFGGRLDDVAPIAEDDPAFDCRAVGNLRCGIGAVLPDGSLAVPGD